MIRFEMPKRECCATTLQPDPQGQWVLYTDGVKAIADAERRAYQTLTGRLEMMERYMKSARYVEALELIVNTHTAIRAQAQEDKEK